MTIQIAINREYGGFRLSDEANRLYKRITGKIYYESHDNRDDPDLIRVIRELGPKRASGESSALMIVELPDGVDWHIVDNDGMEHVAEDHRTWNGDESDGVIRKIVISKRYGGFSLSNRARKMYADRVGKKYNENNPTQFSDIPRNDPNLIYVVETLGPKEASGSHAALEIVCIPYDVEWTIGEHDGWEWVEEVHRTWPDYGDESD